MGGREEGSRDGGMDIWRDGLMMNNYTYRTFGMFCVSLSIASFANGNRSQN